MFHNPALRQNLEALGGFVPLADLHDTLEMVFDPRHEVPGILAVRLEQGKARKYTLDFRQDVLDLLAILDTGTVGHNQ
jgi:hypothetical protein